MAQVIQNFLQEKSVFVKKNDTNTELLYSEVSFWIATHIKTVLAMIKLNRWNFIQNAVDRFSTLSKKFWAKSEIEIRIHSILPKFISCQKC